MTFTAEDTTNHSQFAASGDEIVLVQNTDSGSHTYTISSTADPYGRSGDISAVSIAAGAVHCLRLGLTGWRQTDGKVYLQANDTTVKFAVLSL